MLDFDKLVCEFEAINDAISEMLERQNPDFQERRDKLIADVTSKLKDLKDEACYEYYNKLLLFDFLKDAEKLKETQECLADIQREFLAEILFAQRQLAEDICLHKRSVDELHRMREELFNQVCMRLKLESETNWAYALADYDMPFDFPDMREDGSVGTKIKVHKGAGFPIASIDIEWTPDGTTFVMPYVANPEYMNLIFAETDNANRAECGRTIESIVSNIIYQSFFTYAPDVKIMAYSGNPLIRNLDRNLTQEKGLSERIAVFNDARTFERTVNDAISSQPVDLRSYRLRKPLDHKQDIVVIYVLPAAVDDRQAAEILKTISNWASEFARGIHVFCIYEATKQNTGLQDITSGSYGEDLFEVQKMLLRNLKCDKNPIGLLDWLEYSGLRFNKELNERLIIKNIVAKPMVDEGCADIKLKAMNAILKPPERQIEGGVSVPFANDAGGTPFNIKYTAASASALFLTGAPGTGKSFTLNNYIYNACELYSPEQLQLLLLDCKDCVEMIKFAPMPHVRCVVNADYDILVGIMSYLGRESKRRNRIFQRYKCSNIDAYNAMKKARTEDGMEALPRILLIVDEFGRILKKAADAQSDRKRKEVLDSFNELVATTRFAGIHYLCATQTDSEFRDAFSAGLFNYKATLKQSLEGYRSISFWDLGMGNDTVEQKLFPKIYDNPESRFAPSSILEVVDKWQMFPSIKPVVCNDPNSLPEAESYPKLGEQLSCLQEKCNADGIYLPAGINVRDIFSIMSVPYLYKMEKPHLFVSGNLEHMIEGERVVSGCSAFLEMQIKSIALASARCSGLGAEVMDDVGLFTDEGERNLNGVHFHHGVTAFEDAFRQWDFRRKNSPSEWNFLIILNAEKYLPRDVKAESRILPTDNQSESRLSLPASAVPSSSMDKLAKLRMMSMSMPKLGQVSIGANGTDSMNETVGEAIRRLIHDTKDTRSVIILHSASPSKCDEFLRGRENNKLSRCRFAYFRVTNEEINRKVSSPTSFKIGELSDTCESDDGKQGFIPFKNF